MEIRNWPFNVGAREKLSDQDKQIVRFLEVAYESGFKPYDSDLVNYGATADNHRAGEIAARGRRRWELILGAEQKEVLSAYRDDFGCAADAVLAWLRGGESNEILAQLEHHLVVPPAPRAVSR